jgi:hypothetical protein
MSSIFEAPSSRQRGSWLMVVPAFMAGAIVTFAVSQLPVILYGTPQPTVSSRTPPPGDRQPLGARSDAPKAVVTEPSKMLPDAGEKAPASAAEEGSIQTKAATAPAPDGGAEGKGCTWPYVDQRCAESDSNSGQAASEQLTRSVRVISTDRSAPATLETTGPSTTTVSKPSASPESKQTGTVPAVGGTPTPPTASAAAPARPAPKVATERPSGSQRGAQPGPNAEGRAREPARSRETKQSGSGQREARRARPSEQQSRTARVRNEDERYDDAARRSEFSDPTVVRTHVLPDGRRVTIYRELNPHDEARTVARGETYRIRRVPLLPSYDDDDDY